MGLPGHPNVYIYKNTVGHRPVPHHGTKIGSPAYQNCIQIQSGGLYRTPSCPSLRRRWWPTPTCPRRWRWRTCRTLLPRRQASTSHGGEHSCSPHNGPPWWRQPDTLLQELLVLDTDPHALRHVSKHRLKPTEYVIQLPSGCRRRSMRWPRTRVIKAAPLRRSLGPCWSPSSLIPRTPPSTWWSLLLSLRWRSVQLHLTPARCQICTCTKQATTDGISVYTSKHVHWYIKITIHKYTTYLCGQKPPQEAVPYPGPPGSPPQHRGTGV
jgi:hypothetical protein